MVENFLNAKVCGENGGDETCTSIDCPLVFSFVFGSIFFFFLGGSCNNRQKSLHEGMRVYGCEDAWMLVDL